MIFEKIGFLEISHGPPKEVTLTAGILTSSGRSGEMFFFSGKSLLRVEYVIWIHDIHRICPLKLDLSHRKKIIGVAFDPTKLEAMEVEFFSHFEAKVEKWFFFRENISHTQGGIWETKFFFRFFYRPPQSTQRTYS